MHVLILRHKIISNYFPCLKHYISNFCLPLPCCYTAWFAWWSCYYSSCLSSNVSFFFPSFFSSFLTVCKMIFEVLGAGILLGTHVRTIYFVEGWPQEQVCTNQFYLSMNLSAFECFVGNICKWIQYCLPILPTNGGIIINSALPVRLYIYIYICLYFC